MNPFSIHATLTFDLIFVTKIHSHTWVPPAIACTKLDLLWVNVHADTQRRRRPALHSRGRAIVNRSSRTANNVKQQLNQQTVKYTTRLAPPLPTPHLVSVGVTGGGAEKFGRAWDPPFSNGGVWLTPNNRLRVLPHVG